MALRCVHRHALLAHGLQRANSRRRMTAASAALEGLGAAEHARVVVWLRNDLRVHDNAVLHHAAALSRAGAAVLPLYVYDPRQWAHCRLLPETPRCGPHRARFLAEAVADLRLRLERAGSGLAVAVGRPDAVIAALQPDTVLTQAEFTTEERAAERQVAEAVSAAGGTLRVLPGETLYALQDLPFLADCSDVPISGMTFLKRASSVAAPAAPLCTGLGSPGGDGSLLPLRLWADHPALGAPTDPASWNLCGPLLPSDGGGPAGGEGAGLALLNALLWCGTGAVREYAATRNAINGGSFMSPYLALGCLSARHVAAELARYDTRHPGAEASTGTAPGGLLFELGVRDHCRLTARRHGAALFAEQGPAPSAEARAWCTDPGALDAWRNGSTGVPLVDAIMRQLQREGRISNRARQITASWAVLSRGLDWRRCAEHFESRLIDFDCAANAVNWLTVCGLAGGRENWFNIAKQGRTYDQDGAFIRRWVPELGRATAEHIHEPWTMNDAEQAACGVVLGATYPRAEQAALRTPKARSSAPA
jgi:deoxyribodipyrimidine photo-lyase